MKLFNSISLGCKEASLLCSRKGSERLTIKERILLKIHLFLCKPCLYFLRQGQWIHKSLQSLSSDNELSFSESKKESMQKNIEAIL